MRQLLTIASSDVEELSNVLEPKGWRSTSVRSTTEFLSLSLICFQVTSMQNCEVLNGVDKVLDSHDIGKTKASETSKTLC